MRAAPDQKLIEGVIDDALTHGDKGKVANALQKSASDITQRFNPNEAKQSGCFRALSELWAISGVNPDAAETIFALFDSYRAQWLEETKPTDRCLSSLVGDASAELTALIRARLEGKPAHVQRKEALELRAVVDRFLAGLEQSELRAV